MTRKPPRQRQHVVFPTAQHTMTVREIERTESGTYGVIRVGHASRRVRFMGGRRWVLIDAFGHERKGGS